MKNRINKNWTWDIKKDYYIQSDGCTITGSYIADYMKNWGRKIEQLHIIAVLDKFHKEMH